MPDRVSLKYIIIFLVSLIISTQTFAASLVGDMRATVVEKVIVEGNDLLLTLDRQNPKGSSTTTTQGYTYNGSVIYDIKSEPSSIITVQYQAVDNNNTLKREPNDLSNSHIMKLSFKSNSNMVRVDNKGHGSLSVNPILFFPNYKYDDGHKVVYYITLLY